MMCRHAWISQWWGLSNIPPLKLMNAPFAEIALFLSCSVAEFAGNGHESNVFKTKSYTSAPLQPTPYRMCVCDHVGTSLRKKYTSSESVWLFASLTAKLWNLYFCQCVICSLIRSTTDQSNQHVSPPLRTHNILFLSLSLWLNNY